MHIRDFQRLLIYSMIKSWEQPRTNVYIPHCAGAFRVALFLRDAVEVVGHGRLAEALSRGLDEGVAPPFAPDEVVAGGEASGGAHLGTVCEDDV